MTDEVITTFARESAGELTDALAKIEHCVRQLTDDQIWWRPAPEMNSIGNLILHLCGNVGQWVLAGVGGAEDTRDRPQEFAERGSIPGTDLLRRLSDTVDAAKVVLRDVSGETLQAPLRIQSFEVTGLGAVIHAIAHFRGHTQEIIHITRCQLGDGYEFCFIPRTPEEGAPAE